MASPWQFSPHLPSLSKCSAARSQWQRALRHVFSKTALAAIRDRDPEPALLEPYADRKACVQVVIDHQDVTHDPPPLRYRMRRAGDPSLKKGRPFTQTPGGFLPCESARYRISAANHRPVCPPQCIWPVPQPDTLAPVNSYLRWHSFRRAVVDAGHSSPRLRCERGLHPPPSIAEGLARSGVAGFVLETLCCSLAAAEFVSRSRHHETASAALDDGLVRTNAAVGTTSVGADFRAPRDAAHFKNT